MTIPAPWLSQYGHIPAHLDYPDLSMVQLVERACAATPDLTALEFQGCRTSYAQLRRQIDRCARALAAAGVRPGDRVTLCLPNTPQAVYLLYAVNQVGALANMIHPLSGQEEILTLLKMSDSRFAVTLDLFYGKFAAIQARSPLKTLVVTDIGDALPPPKRALYALTAGRKAPAIPQGAPVLRWRDFLSAGQTNTGECRVPRRGEDAAVILYSGGTTGKPKGIVLSNRNFNALALQTGAAGDCLHPGHKMLSILPMFHGFGLGVCVHTVLVHSGRCILIPRFHADQFGRLLRRHRPHYLAGVPTLFEAMLRSPHLKKADFSQLEGVFSGGDSLSVELKRKIDAFLTAHGSTEQVREGYGTTECVTASCLTPRRTWREGSIGIPFPDTYYQIVAPGGQQALPYGQVGEICISGPTVMQGYLDQPEETARVLQRHPDGALWLHTGDLGYMDEDGFVYFRQRMGRMIITSGYNVYPSQVENVLDAHPAVRMSTVIGVKDDYRMQAVRAYVVLQEGVPATDDTRARLRAWCQERMARYAVPRDFVFRDSLPQTAVGKVAYTELEREAEQAAQS